jgi:hypothetical protein
MTVVEFARAFAPGLATDSLNKLTLDKLLDAVSAQDNPSLIGEILAALLITLMEIEEGPCRTNRTSPFAFHLSDLPVNAATSSEVVCPVLPRHSQIFHTSANSHFGWLGLPPLPDLNGADLW